LSREDFYTPTDIDALRMENELLAFEARFLRTKRTAREEELERYVGELKGRLEESERRLEESERRLEESERRLEESEHRLEESEHRLEESERAEHDIILLLQRLANSPLGWFFATKQNFRILEQRYLGGDD
jgi:septal ring factor EnvC (AmiA/AmiB activator)